MYEIAARRDKPAVAGQKIMHPCFFTVPPGSLWQLVEPGGIWNLLWSDADIHICSHLLTSLNIHQYIGQGCRTLQLHILTNGEASAGGCDTVPVSKRETLFACMHSYFYQSLQHDICMPMHGARESTTSYWPPQKQYLCMVQVRAPVHRLVWFWW